MAPTSLRRDLRDRGTASLAAVLVSLVLLMIIAVGVLRQYAFAAASSLQARAHAEAVAVLSWKAAEYGANGCPTTTPPIPPVTTLGPDKLTPPEGFRVTCVPVDVWWPPPLTATPSCNPYDALTKCAPFQELKPSLVISVSWGPVDSERTLDQTVVYLS